jgi:hypothetical protein
MGHLNRPGDRGKPSWLGADITALEVVRLSAELAGRDMSQWSLERFCSTAHVWPVLSLYSRLAAIYEKASRELYRWEAILRRTEEPQAADRFRSEWGDHDAEALQALLHLGILLSLPCLLWWKERMRTAAEGLAVRLTAQEKEPAFLGLSRSDMARLLGMLPQVEKELFSVRGREDRGPDYEGVRGEADASALWEAYQRADEAVRASVPNLAKRFRESGDPYAEFEALPFIWCFPAEEQARSIMRKTYRDLKPKVLTDSFPDLPPSGDGDREPDDRDPADHAAYREKERWRESELDALVAEREEARAVLSIRHETQREASTALWERARVELAPKQYEVLRESEQALRDGYSSSSKSGRSMRQYWGDEYNRKRRMLNRVEKEHCELVRAIRLVGLPPQPDGCTESIEGKAREPNSQP